MLGVVVYVCECWWVQGAPGSRWQQSQEHHTPASPLLTLPQLLWKTKYRPDIKNDFTYHPYRYPSTAYKNSDLMKEQEHSATNSGVELQLTCTGERVFFALQFLFFFLLGINSQTQWHWTIVSLWHQMQTWNPAAFIMTPLCKYTHKSGAQIVSSNIWCFCQPWYAVCHWRRWPIM